ncbi:hypothetical protein MMC30_009415 [Trapelia coarctata]|nr:hypothetical protein [Trapelia coarctata]
MAELAHVQDIWAKMLPISPIYTHLLSTITLTSATPGTITARLPLLPIHLNSKGTLHGTVSACLVDWAGGMAIASTGREKTGVSTDLHTSFVGTAGEGDVLVVEGRVSRVGGTMAYTSVEIRKEGGGEVVATGLHTKFVR